MRRIALLAVAVLPFSALRAQWAEIQPGAKVRITAPGVLGARLEGTVFERTADTVFVVRDGRLPVRVPLAAIRSGEVSLGKSRRSGAVSGMKWGAGIGLGLGLVVALTPDSELEGCDPTIFDCTEEVNDFGIVALTTVSSALGGAGIGALIGKERWQRLSAPVSATAARVWVAPTPRHGVAVGMRAAF